MKENNNNHCVRKVRKVIIHIPKNHVANRAPDEEAMNAFLHSLFGEKLKETCPSRAVCHDQPTAHHNPETPKLVSVWHVGKDGKNHCVKIPRSALNHHSHGSAKVWWSTNHGTHPVCKVKMHKAKDCEIPKIEESLVSEMCPHCDAENTFVWDVTRDGIMAFCAHCGKPMLICSMCEDQCCGKCPHETK